MTTTVARMIQRSDTSSGWSTENPVLADGELGWDTDLDVLKVGDGTTAWNDLDVLLTLGGGQAVFEARVDRAGAVTGEVPILQADGTLAFGAAGGGGNSDGAVYLPEPTGVAATDDAALAAAITTATADGLVIIALPGTYAITSRHVIPDGVDLRGQGGGSTSRAGRTVFRCEAAAAAIAIYGGGGLSGGFEVDGNSTANTPFERQGGLGANARLFQNITAHDNTGASNDLALFHGAQNDLWVQCGFAESSRDLGYFDQGYGGATFLRCEWRTAARYHHRYDNLISSPTYQVPTDIHHIGGIIEGAPGTSTVKVNAGANVTYTDHAFYTASAPSGPMVDIADGYGLSLHNPWMQCGTSTVAGTVGIMVRGTANLTVSGRALLQNLDNAVQVDGLGAFIYAKCNWLFTGVNTNFSGINSGTVAQISDLALGGRTAVGASTDFAEVCQPLARDRFLFSRTYAGVLSWYPNTAGNFTPDVQVIRRAVGCVGTINGTQQVLATGSGTTAQRPAAAVPLTGALYNNTETGSLQVCNGTSWVDAGSSSTIQQNTQTADYTLVMADSGKVVEVNSATGKTVTVPPNSSVAYPIGTVIEVCQMGVGTVTIAPGSGVTLRTPASLTTRTQYSTIVLRKRATDEWVLGGDLT